MKINSNQKIQKVRRYIFYSTQLSALSEETTIRAPSESGEFLIRRVLIVFAHLLRDTSRAHNQTQVPISTVSSHTVHRCNRSALERNSSSNLQPLPFS